MIKTRIIIACALVVSAHVVRGMDNAHFYRARLWTIDEPRYNKPGLQTFNAFFAGGDSHTAFNAHGKKVPLLALYGNENLNALGIHEPGISKKCTSAFFSGDFEITEIQLHAISNFDCGFFAHCALPIRKIQIESIKLNNVCKLDRTDGWIASVSKLDALLKESHLSICPVRESGVGDFSVLAGWTYTNYDTYADFIDATLQTGVLFPTGKKKNPHQAFSLPLGYDGHYGVPIIADGAIGMLDWLNLGARAEGLFFFDSTRTVRIKTDPCEEGFIRPSEGRARVKSGPLWDLTVYLKADHFTHGVSFLLGYSFDHKNRSFIHPCSSKFNRKIANTDPQLRSWSMGTLHATFEYDWENDDNPYGPRIGIEYNHVLHGQNVFRTPLAGGWIGFDLVWQF